jgi:hypothetical protein
VSAADRLDALDGCDELRHSESTARTEGDDPSMDERLAELAVTEAGVERLGQPLDGFGACQIDQRPCAARARQALDHCPVDQVERRRAVDAVTEPADVAIAKDRDVERWLQAEAVEAVERCGGRTARPHLATDVDDQREEFGARVRRSAGQSERIRADLEEGTARDSAPKLCVGHANAVRLPSRQQAQLTSRDRHEPAVGGGHGGHPRRRVSRSCLSRAVSGCALNEGWALMGGEVVRRRVRARRCSRVVRAVR